MFDWAETSEKEIIQKAENLPPKLLRWLGENHPDNRTRKLFFKLSNIEIPDSTVINKHFVVSDDYQNLLTIGERVAIAPNVTIICTSGPNNSHLQNLDWVRKNLIVEKPVIIGDDAWIGANVVILPGVTIGKGCVVGAGSIVNKDTQDYSVVAGSPAVEIKNIPEI